MNGTTGSSQDLGDKPATRPVPSPAVPDRLARRLSWAAAAGILTSIAIMIAASALRNSWEHPYVVMPPDGMPWSFRLHLSLTLVSAAMWAAVVLAAGGVIAGLAAVARGARPSVRLVLGVGLVAVAVLTVLPAAGSNDTLDYAAFGRMMVLGHNPYVMTPDQLRHLGDPVGLATPLTWGKLRTVYGPLATAEQWAAASLGGTSAARIVFWLKLWNALAFLAVALGLDRLLRSDPARRLRAHLLWTVNPLLLWGLVAEGHVDVMAAAAGLFGLAVLRKRGDGDPGALRGLAAGLLVGAAADLKITYVLFGVALAWAARNWMATWFSAAAGAALVLFPSYLWFGPSAARALLSRDGQASIGNFYQTVIGSHQVILPHLLLLGGLACAAVAVLVLVRLPDGVPDLPAIRPALALSVAWLFLWPYQFPWYGAMAICLLALYPASRLDWLILIRLAAGTFALMPGNAGFPAQPVLSAITRAGLYYLAPAVLLAAAAALVWLCVTRRWRMDPPTVIPATGLRVPA